MSQKLTNASSLAASIAEKMNGAFRVAKGGTLVGLNCVKTMNRQRADARPDACVENASWLCALKTAFRTVANGSRGDTRRTYPSNSMRLLAGLVALAMLFSTGCCLHLTGPGCRLHGCRNHAVYCPEESWQQAPPPDTDVDVPVSKFIPVPTKNIFLPDPSEDSPRLLDRRLLPLPRIDQSVQMYDLYDSRATIVGSGQTISELIPVPVASPER